MPVDSSARARIEQILERGRVPGCSLAVVQGGAVERDAFGFSDLRSKRPVSEETIFHLFSGTKLYTAAALMILVERGLVSLDEPVATYLEELPLRHPVTLRQLASHNSGLRDTLRAFFAVHLRGEATPSTADALARYRLDHGKEPGGGVAYRNANYAILGEVISRVSEQPYASFVRDSLLVPLGAGVSFEEGEGAESKVATGYIGRFTLMRLLIRLIVPGLLQRVEDRPLGRRVELHSFALDTAAIGGLVGTAQDFIPFLTEFLSQEDGVLSAESKRTTLTLQAKGRAGIASKTGVGIGWKLGELAGGTEFWNHEGGGPGFTSETRIYPADGMGVVLLMNTMHSAKISWLAHEICETLRATYSS